MSGAPACKCKPRNLVIIDYRCNHSAFNGYHRTPSDYSCLRCLTCGSYFRTKADYVRSLPFATDEQRQQTIQKDEQH